MSSILNSINEADIGCKVKEEVLKSMKTLVEDFENIGLTEAKDMRRKILLDLDDDPDPYGLHGLPLKYRLLCMGWPEGGI